MFKIALGCLLMHKKIVKSLFKMPKQSFPRLMKRLLLGLVLLSKDPSSANEKTLPRLLLCTGDFIILNFAC